MSARLSLGALGALGALGVLAAPALAQERLLGAATVSTGVVVENWSLPTAAEVQSTSGDAMYISGTTQVTVPAAALVPLGGGWFADLYTAYVSSVVRLGRPNADGDTRLMLSGPTDSRVRLVGHLADDRLTLTLGVTAPTGHTRLEGSEMDALSVVSSPGLALRTPGLGSGLAATVGAVYTQRFGASDVAVGTSYEYRGAYTPSSAVEAGLMAGSLRAGGVTRFTLGIDHASGILRHTLDLSAGVPQRGSLELDLPGGTSTDEEVRTAPIIAGLYQLDAVGARTQGALFVSARYRGMYQASGESVEGSDRTEIGGGAQGALQLAPTASLRLAIDGRRETLSAGHPPGAVADGLVGFSSSGITAFGGTLALRLENGTHTLAAEPFARGQVGRLEFAGYTQTATGVGAGITLSARF